MSRLVVVSNRVPDLSDTAQAGGLAVGVGDVLKHRGGIWFGWDGEVVSSGVKVPPTVTTEGKVTTVTLPLTRKDYNEYYAGFANRVLWPIFHYRLDLSEFEKKFLKGYKRVNSKFADALAPLLKPKDQIWIHDYHLIPLASELRSRGHKQRIGFFLHIPFPPPEVLAATPEHEWLIKSLFAYDLIGFQSQTDLSNFEHFVEEQMQGEVYSDGVVTAIGKNVTARSFPIGIDVDGFRALAFNEEADQRIDLLKRRTTAGRQIIGVDRLDYSKGLPNRIVAFRRLLQKYPKHLKAVTLMQIAPPTREDVGAYADIRQELEMLSGATNGEFADFDWTPVRYIHRVVPRHILAALFRGSQVGFVTPLRDGMNLVAKEYVAAQESDNPGVLVLSQFAGAAEQMEEALIVNPYDVEEMADALHRALEMPIKEKMERQEALMKRIRDYDAAGWQKDFLSALGRTKTGLAA